VPAVHWLWASSHLLTVQSCEVGLLADARSAIVVLGLWVLMLGPVC
jgi:hypothetical protein